MTWTPQTVPRIRHQRKNFPQNAFFIRYFIVVFGRKRQKVDFKARIRRKNTLFWGGVLTHNLLSESIIGPELLVSKTLILGRFYQFRKLKYALFSQGIR